MEYVRQILERKRSPEGWPKHLYKYRPLRSETDLARAIRVLDGAIYAAHRATFNDPFDCSPVAEIRRRPGHKRDVVKDLVFEENRSINRRARRVLLQGARRNLEGFDLDRLLGQVLAGLHDRTGVVSLSSKPDDLLMWGHYASEHTGICLRLNIEERGANIRYAYPIRYSDDRPIVMYPFRDDDEELIVAAFLVKARCWQYECEWRLLYHDGPGEKPFRATSADGIIFGARTPETYIRALSEHIRSGTSARMFDFYKAELDRREFRMHLVPAT